MYHFFVEPSQIYDKRVIITGEDVKAMKSATAMA